MAFSQKKLLNFIISIAILSGIGRVAIDYISRFLALAPIAYYMTFFIAFIAEISIIIYAIKTYKKKNGTLTIIDALKTGIVIMAIIGLCYCSMAYIYDMYIDPEFQTNLRVAFTEQYTPDQVEQVKETIKNQDTSKSYFGVITYTIWFIFLGAVISLIAGAALMTKEEKK